MIMGCLVSFKFLNDTGNDYETINHQHEVFDLFKFNF
jgi:hypothetical protein